ncbi:MAPEG family protein [Tepidicaulis sp. LMO-SS28]|uniref:MAPEG family protein n=1 Tax=Tepidicaulis sp. LMO-SS28 TaxID=3447455 RepID=UPI003EE15C6C
MTEELWLLFASTCLGLVYLAAASFSFKAQTGNRYTVGPRDEDIRPAGLAGRLARAQQNFNETFPLFAALALLLHVTETSGAWSLLGAHLYFWGRVAFLPLYAMGVPWLRTVSWNILAFGIALMGAQLLLTALS